VIRLLTGRKRWLIVGAAAVGAILSLAAVIFRGDIISTTLDPKEPFQTYEPPPAPNYAERQSWARLPDQPTRWTVNDGPADIFFIHPTTFNGGEDWNGPIGEPRADRILTRTMIPNYAGPFQAVGRVFAPRYRQASLYSFLTNRDDAREARRFAYGDVRAAFMEFAGRYNRGRPLIIVGVEQGGQLAARLAADVVVTNPNLMRRLAGVYVIDAVVPADDYRPGSALPACGRRGEARCMVAWAGVANDDKETAERILPRAFVWNAAGQLEPLGARAALCVNPLTGGAGGVAEARFSLGAANASGMEWGARPAFIARQVSARCEGGLLRYSVPISPVLRLAGAWADRRKVAPYNLFYADLESDAKTRVLTLMNRTDFPRSAASIDNAVVVGPSPIRRID
jgi:hypothetical protein